jgi:hypothetical protein
MGRKGKLGRGERSTSSRVVSIAALAGSPTSPAISAMREAVFICPYYHHAMTVARANTSMVIEAT